MVTTMDGSFSPATSPPLIAPQTRPVPMPIITRPGVPTPACAAAPIAVEASAMIAATERSISPEIMRSVIAKAINAFSVKLNVASDRFQALRK